MSWLWIEPALAEEAVFERIRALERAGDPRAGDWHREREALYAQPEGAARERAFGRLASTWFERLGLDRPLSEALAATARVRGAVVEVRLHRAGRPKAEGSELFRDGGHSTLVFALTPARFAEPDRLIDFFLRECLHAEDMLEPAFGYRPDLGPGLLEEPARTELVRDRVRVLWEARVRSRMAAILGAPAALEPAPAFLRAFAGALEPAGIHALHERVRSGELATFAGFLGAARAGLTTDQAHAKT